MIRLFGPRVLLKFVPHKERIGRIYIPDSAGAVDTHRMGVIENIGSEVKHKNLKIGDTVIFQVNDIMKWAQVYRRMQTGDDLLHLLESELIGKINGKEVRPESLEILGDYVLFEPKAKQVEGSIILPGNAGLTPEFVKYTMIQKGPFVDLPIHKGQEIIVNHGRISPMLFKFDNRHGDPETREYGYTLKDWVHGCIEGDDGDEEGETGTV